VGDALLALLSELLVVTGIATGLYVVYLAWWTDVDAAGEQAAMVDRLHRRGAAPGGVPHHGPAPVLEEPSAVAAVFGTVQIPRFGADYVRPLGQGTDRRRVLNTIGLGHYEHTAMPGDIGNVAVAGHRVTYGKPLNRIAELREGDPVVVRVTDTAAGFDTWYVYRVVRSRIVTPEHTEVIAPVPDHPGQAPTAEDRWLTFTACHPMWSARERYVTFARLDSWMPASEGTPVELRAAA